MSLDRERGNAPKSRRNSLGIGARVKARIRLEIEEFRNMEGAIVEEREAASCLMGATPHATIDDPMGTS